jgi:Copper type II ascorbate-dependent monooxygenase, C-terminal domain
VDHRGAAIVLLLGALLLTEGCGSDSKQSSDSRDSTGIPCDAAAILTNRCTHCHATTPILGAPMPLMSWADFQAPAPSNRSRTVAQVVLERIHSDTRPMPPPPMARLDGAEDRLLTAWLEGGTPQSEEVCDDKTVVVGMEPLPCTPTEIYRTHVSGSLDEAYPVGTGDYTICFEFMRPASFGQAVAWGPVLGDVRALHHINLHASASPVRHGAVGPCVHTGLTYLMGWEAGRKNAILPPDVGLELPGSSGGMVLEVHYFNPTGHQNLLDRSGMAICTVDQPRPQTAGVLTFGTKSILLAPNSEAEVVGTCPATITEGLSRPLNVLASAPHMHRLGLSLQTEIQHADGTVELLSRVDSWDPGLQPFYTHDPVVPIKRGDVIRTACHFSNTLDKPVSYGTTTADEMCFNYNIVYPISALPPSIAADSLRLCDCPAGQTCAP